MPERQCYPNFPVPFSLLQGVKSVTEIVSGDFASRRFQGSCASIESLQRKHGYRIEHDGRSLAYCLDHEHGDTNDIHPGVMALAQNADMLVFDAAIQTKSIQAFAVGAIQLGRKGVRLPAH